MAFATSKNANENENTAGAITQQQQQQTITDDAYRQLITNELERVGKGGPFVWLMFVLCVSPNILNGFHVSSYTLLGALPEDQWCDVTTLRDMTNWTVSQKRSLTEQGLPTKGCTIRNWDYVQLSSMSYEKAYNFTQQAHLRGLLVPEIKCKAVLGGANFEFQSPESTFVAQWELICDRSIQRTSAQVFVSLGKFFGSFSFGIFADKYGRKSAFILGAIFFIVSSVFCTFSPWYSLFLAGRFGLGTASSGLFYPAFTMVVENICIKHRSWMSIAFPASYPIGMILLALAAHLLENWRYLQFALTVPSFLLIFNCYLISESPRWLITKGHYDRAYKILFKRDNHYKLQPTISVVAKKTQHSEKNGKASIQSLGTRFSNGLMMQFYDLYGSSYIRKMIFVSYFMFCVSSLCYYVTALNASNLSVSKYLYVALTGLVDLPSYLMPVIMLRYIGRRPTTMLLFLFSSISLLLVLAVPADNTTGIIIFAMLGRFGISATYAIVTLYTAELYPTEIRNSSLGTCSTFAHIGSISAPYVVDVLGMLGWYIPTTICAACALLAALLTLTLPETAETKLSDHMKEVSFELEVKNRDNKTANL